MRTSRRKNHVGRRQTKKQRGGAPFYTIPVARIEDWRSAISDRKLFDSLSTLFENRETMVGREEEIMNHYINILERQDDLFAAAMDIIRKKLGVASTDDIIARAVEIDGRRAEFMPYIDDVENLINFTIDGAIDRRLGATKLQQIRSESESLSTLLLFPARLQNVFIQSLAQICVGLLKDADILTKLTSPNAQQILAEQYKAYTHSTAYQMTARDLRDGFFLNQGVADFKGNVSQFWKEFVAELVKIRDIANIGEVFTQPGVCPHNLHTVSWGYIAANVYGLAKLGNVEGLLQLFADPCLTTEPLPEDAGRTHIPNAKYDAAVIRGGPTFAALMSNMDDTTLQFLLQLSYTIQKLQAEEPTS